MRQTNLAINSDRLDRIEARIDRLERQQNERLDRIEARIDRLENRQYERYEHLRNRMLALERKQAWIQGGGKGKRYCLAPRTNPGRR